MSDHAMYLLFCNILVFKYARLLIHLGLEDAPNLTLLFNQRDWIDIEHATDGVCCQNVEELSSCT